MSRIEAHSLEGYLSRLVEKCEHLAITFGVQNGCSVFAPFTIGKDFVAGNNHPDPNVALPVVAPYSSIQYVTGHKS
jgi:hypothetical protein